MTRAFLIIVQYVSAVLALLFGLAFVFALVAIGAVLWWQPVSFVFFGGLAYGSRWMRQRVVERSTVSARREE